MMRLLILGLALAHTGALTAEQQASNTANPVRKVVTMLQMMMKKIEVEGEKQQELYDKFMCYCDNADATLGKSIADADTKIPQLESDIKEGEALMSQLKADIEQAKA